MKMAELRNALNEVVPTFYHKAKVGQTLPYIAYEQTESNNLSADDKVYVKVDNYDINLYTEIKDLKLENRIESVLDGLGLHWEKSESYFENEDYLIHTYSVEFIRED